LRDRSLQAAKANVVVGNQMATRILSRNMDLHRVHVIPNWVDDAEISPLPPSDNPLRRQWELEDKFVVGYSGNLGRPHEFNTILAASILLKDHPRIIFLCIGGGHSFDSLARSVEKFGLRRLFRFFPYQNQSLLKYSLGVADVHWISLKPQLEGLILPSKFYGIAAAGRPIIAITAKDGEIAELIEQHACGIIIAPGDAKALFTPNVPLTLRQR
jgi:colanic acid biosynthesis glycosyl transferase WcaI